MCMVTGIDPRALPKVMLLCIVISIAVASQGCTSNRDTTAKDKSPGKGGTPSKPITPSTDPQHGSNVAQNVMAAQIPLLELAEQLKKSAGASDALGGIQIDIAGKAVQVWWKGALGEEQRGIIDKANSQGIRVSAKEAKYSQTELLAAIQKYLDRTTPRPEELSYLAPSVDGSGVEVGATTDLDAQRLDLGVDSYLVRASRLQNLTRAADTAPWFGGALVAGVGAGGVCTSGFAVNWAFSVDRAAGTGLLTANHCAPGGGVVFNNGAGAPVGTADPRPVGRSVVLDSLVIRTPTAPAAAIYDGGVGVNESAKPVVGFSNGVSGMAVCHSGAVTGAACGLFVSTIKATAFVGSGFTQSLAIATPLPVGRRPFPVARTGDSGGPVFTLASNPSWVNAAGILVGSLFLNCPSSSPLAGVRCQQSVAFVDMDVLIFHSVSLMTQ